MRKYLLILVLFFSLSSMFSQDELNAIVTINSDKVQSTNKQVYKTLETSIFEFINQTKWTDKTFLPQERINCAFNIIVSEQNGNNFVASIQVQATRPVYGSTYETPIVNTNDTNFSFRYNEFDPLIFNPNSFDSNLVSTIVFYIYTILGVDADTFALKGGQQYLKKAQDVALQAQQSGSAGWQDKIGVINRFALIDNLMSSKFQTLRTIYYEYHLKGLDNLATKEKESKNEILKSVLKLERLFNITVGNNMIRFFLDAKLDEIVKVFSGGISTGKEEKLREMLQKISPTMKNKWSQIKS